MIEKCDGILFDVDGTMWDSTERSAGAYNRVIDKYIGPGYPRVTADTLRHLFGKTTAEIGKGIFPDYSPEEQLEWCRECIAGMISDLHKAPPDIYPGLRGAIKKLYKKFPLFVVSNCESGYIELLLESNDLGSYFTDHLCLGDTGMKKAGNIAEILRRYHLKNAFYVGDVQGDADASHEAGIPIIWAKYGFGDIHDAEYAVNTPEELPVLFGL